MGWGSLFVIVRPSQASNCRWSNKEETEIEEVLFRHVTLNHLNVVIRAIFICKEQRDARIVFLVPLSETLRTHSHVIDILDGEGDV